MGPLYCGEDGDEVEELIRESIIELPEASCRGRGPDVGAIISSIDGFQAQGKLTRSKDLKNYNLE